MPSIRLSVKLFKLIALFVLLQTVSSVPVRTSRQANAGPLKLKFAVGLKTAKTILNKEFQAFNTITDSQNFREVINDVSKMVLYQSTVSEMMEELGQNSPINLNVTKLLLDEVINHACDWIKMVLNNDTFSCLLPEMQELNLKFQLHTVLQSLYADLNLIENIDTCHWILCEVACNPNVDPDVVNYILENHDGKCLPHSLTLEQFCPIKLPQCS